MNLVRTCLAKCMKLILYIFFSAVGVAIGAGWQNIVAYVNLGCYYIIGVPVGIVLGNVFHLQVKVGFHFILYYSFLNFKLL